MSLFFFGGIVARADIEPQISWNAGYQEIFSAAYLFTFGFQGGLRVVDDIQQTPNRYLGPDVQSEPAAGIVEGNCQIFDLLSFVGGQQWTIRH
tara:strand:+ start:520 stop:798 length:279 start_codon:yes stop_codon:yes gene_type:complete